MWHTMSSLEVEKKLNTNESYGLSTKEVNLRLKKYGYNILNEKKKVSIFIKFINQFKDFMTIILLIAAGISAVLAYIDGTNDYMDSVIIIAIVVFNAIMGLVQESKAEKSIEALKKLSSPVAKVLRDSTICTIDSSKLVPGDIIYLEAGNLVPADCRLISSFNLKIEESTLTGEAVPVLKDANSKLPSNIPTSDMINMAFASTIISNGHAKAIVTETGINTKVGKVANMIMTNDISQTPLQKKLSDVGKKLGIVCIIICCLIFVIGILKNISFMEIFMTSIGLAVAAIPEGLPAIVTIMLSIGVTKMSKKNAIIRKLPAVETLGGSSVICSDKTGTLTQNKMQVVNICGPLGEYKKGTNNLDFSLELGSLCNDSTVTNKGTKNQEILGDPTETAIVNAAIKNKSYNCFYERINEIPFDSERKMMTTIHKIKNRYRIITKGAPDVVVKRCKNYYDCGNVLSLNSSISNSILSQNEKMANNALRVLAISYKDVTSLPKDITTSSIENNLTFVGLIGMIDPPRNGVFEAILTCKKAGIKTVMITGDHLLTAKAIAKNLGILSDGELAISGDEIDNMTTSTLEKNIMKYSVFARVSPEHKVKIVNAYKKAGNTVAMTGDGVNDAPALKSADIGISMGKNGTDVAKEASDMILTDDNFVTIVEAVKEGRHIYDNIKKAIHFLIATNVGEIVTIFLGLLLGLDTPLLAIHLLWINLVTDSLPAIALGLEPIDKHAMNKKPKSKKKSIFSDGLWSKILFEGLMIGFLTLFSFTISTRNFGIDVGRTTAFIVLSMSELIHSFNVRSEDSIFEIGIFSNIYLIGSFLLGAFLQVIVVTNPLLQEIFNVVTLNQSQWIFAILISISPIFILELSKKIHNLIYGKRIYITSKDFSKRTL